MKTIKKVLILSLLAAPILFIGCQKDVINEPVQTPDEIIDNTSIEQKDYCGETETFRLKFVSTAEDFGSVTIGNDETGLIFNFEIDGSNDFTIRETYIYIQNDGGTPPDYIADVWNPDGTAHFPNPTVFPYYENGLNTKVYQVVITFAELESSGIDLDVCLEIVAGANINDPNTNIWRRVFAEPNLKTYGWYVDFCLDPCEPDCETVYAYGEDLAMCFLDFTGSNNWGWTNGPISDGFSDSWPIYAGAGQCDISKGTHVGYLEVSYSGGTVDVNYIIFPEYTLDETHVHIGDADNLLPWNKKGEYITAPGQYNYNGADFPMSGFTGDIYITAHGVVCGDFE